MTRRSSSQHFAIAREALARGSAGEEIGPSTSSDSRTDRGSDAHLERAPAVVLEQVRHALKGVSQCWESIGRCLSSWGAAQAGGSDAPSQDGSSVVELLSAMHGFSACLSDRVIPAVDSLVSDVPWSLRLIAQREGVATLARSMQQRPAGAFGINGYVSRASARLRQAPGAIGFEESKQTQLHARRLSAEAFQMQGEFQQQVRRLQAVTDEKAALVDELRTLQDKYAVLKSNAAVMQTTGEQHAPQSAVAPMAASSHVAPFDRAVSSSAPSDLVLSSRQRALLESLSVTAQESAAVRQHGFFIDVISLSAGEAGLAAGPPDVDAPETWESAVRKVYEQHCRNLQMQVKTADSKALELQLSVQDSIHSVREHEADKQKLRDEVVSKHAQLDSVNEDMATTRKNYDNQLAMLTEHICTLQKILSEKDTSLASLQAQKILCGHCGMWNIMGKLLSNESDGMCQTCKEKVLSRA